MRSAGGRPRHRECTYPAFNFSVASPHHPRVSCERAASLCVGALRSMHSPTTVPPVESTAFVVVQFVAETITDEADLSTTIGKVAYYLFECRRARRWRVSCCVALGLWVNAVESALIVVPACVYVRVNTGAPAFAQAVGI